MRLTEAFALCLVVWPFGGFVGCDSRGRSEREVVIYTSVDRPYSEPVLKAFEATSGIAVKARYDTEADKTTGLYNKLVEERNHPRADVFWNSEVLRTVLLAREGLLSPYASPEAAEIPSRFRGEGELWTGFAARLRVLIYNTEQISEEEAPTSIADLTDRRWRGRVCMALPIAGTTQTHVGALWARLGAERAGRFLRALVANDVRMVNGNAVVRDLVCRGEMAVGLTDTDDANEGLRRGSPIRVVFPDQTGYTAEQEEILGVKEPLGVFLIPNTVALVDGGPNPETARRLIDFLVSPQVESRLAASGAVQIPVRKTVEPPKSLSLPTELKTLEIGYEEAARGVEEADPFVRALFLR